MKSPADEVVVVRSGIAVKLRCAHCNYEVLEVGGTCPATLRVPACAKCGGTSVFRHDEKSGWCVLREGPDRMQKTR